MKKLSKSVLLFGATGTIGRAAARAMIDEGHKVTCVVRAGSAVEGLPKNAVIWANGIGGIDTTRLNGFDAVMSCIASRTGAPADAWAVDHDMNVAILKLAKDASIRQFLLLSAICVQKPLLEFQKAKLAFEEALKDSGLMYSIVRPTAFFKSLSGQVERVQNGKPFMMFGDGTLTACKPISDRDLGRYLTFCITNRDLQNRVLPIGGPGDALTPHAQGEMLFRLLEQEPKFRSMPVWAMDMIIRVLKLGGRINPALRAKAELAKIGRYYGTQSMLVWDGEKHDADATPSFGDDTLEDHYRAMIAGDVAADLGDHKVF